MEYIEVIDVEPRLPPDAAYSRAIRAGNLIFVHGQTGFDLARQQLVQGGVGPETAQTLRRMDEILRAGGASLKDVVQVTCYVADINDLDALNAAYAPFFQKRRPARTVVQVAALHLGAAIEMDAIAVIEP